MASIGRNMYLSSITIIYTLSDIVVFDCIPFPTTDINFQLSLNLYKWKSEKPYPPIMDLLWHFGTMHLQKISTNLPC